MSWLTVAVLTLFVWSLRQRNDIRALRLALQTVQRDLGLLRAPLTAPAFEAPSRRSPWPDRPTPLTPKPDMPDEAAARSGAPTEHLLAAAHDPADLGSAPAKAPPERTDRPARRPLSELLAEKGLAWLGGAGLAIGGAFLVGYMAQQGWFNPLVRLCAAVLLGVGLVGAGEGLLRRGERRPELRNPLVAALAAGSGSAVLYAAVWAAYDVYGYIPAPLAAGLLAAVSALLFSLGLRHGQPLAGLALGAAFAVPALTGAGAWSGPALPLYVLTVAGAGALTAQRRGWTESEVLAVAGVLGWGLLAIRVGAAQTAVLSAGAAAIAAALALRPGQVGEHRLAAAAPALGAMILTLAAVSSPDLWVQAGLSAVVLIAALTARRGRTPADALAAAVVLAAAGTAVLSLADGGPLRGLALGHAALAAAATLLAVANHERRATAAGAAAVSAVVLAVLLGHDWGGAATWAVPAATALALAAAAAFAARASGEAPAVNLWAGSAAAAGLAAGVQWADPVTAPAALAALAVLYAALHRRWPWLGLRFGLMAAGALALGAGLNPAFVEAGWSARPVGALGSAAAAAAALWLASRLARSGRELREGIATGAIGLALIAAFVAVNWAAARGLAQPLDLLSRAALYGLLLLGGGVAALASEGSDAGPIARVRSRVLLGAGALYALLVGAILSPWWGAAERVVGAPLLDSLTLAYLAPAVLAGVAADRLYRRTEPLWARVMGGVSTLLAGLWLLQLVRRLFDGPVLRIGGTGPLEAAVYALLLLAVPLAFEGLRRRRRAPQGGDMARAANAFAWTGLAVSALLIGVVWNPWWGPQSLGATPGPLLMLAAYAAAAALSFGVPRALLGSTLRAAGRVAAAFHAWVGLTLAIRLAYLQSAPPVLGRGNLETWTYSSLWTLYGVALLAVSARRADPALRWSGLAVVGLAVGKVLLFDLAMLDGVVRAASFLAVGALLLVGALTARGGLKRGAVSDPPG